MDEGHVSAADVDFADLGRNLEAGGLPQVPTMPQGKIRATRSHD